jgi:hypothetical protein
MNDIEANKTVTPSYNIIHTSYLTESRYFPYDESYFYNIRLENVVAYSILRFITCQSSGISFPGTK